jgi:hypothetical protein
MNANMRGWRSSTALTLMLSGCASVADPPTDYRLGERSEGLLVATLTLTGSDAKQGASVEYWIRRAPGGEGFDKALRVPHFDSALQHARWTAAWPRSAADAWRLVPQQRSLRQPADDSNRSGREDSLAVLRLPPGEYEVHGWKAVLPSRYGSDVLTPSRARAYRFRVEAGKAVYVGNIELELAATDSARISVRDEAARDLVLLKKRLPSLSDEDITTVLLRARN